MNLEHIGIYARNPAQLAKWYADVLDLKEVLRIEKEGRPPVVFLQGETGAIVEILPTDAAGVERDLKCPGFTHVGIAVDDFGAQQQRLAKIGVEVTNIRSTSNGWQIGYLHDPEGNILELVQR